MCIWIIGLSVLIRDLYQFVMLKFVPVNSIQLTPNQQQHLQGDFCISNPTVFHVAFKVKSTQPELFNVTPHAAILRPQDQAVIKIVTIAKHSPDLARDLAQNHKFMIEYVLLEQAPASLHEGLLTMKPDIRQSHKMYITAGSQMQHDREDQGSDISNKYSFRTAQQHVRKGGVSYRQMSEEQKFDQLRGQIEELEREKFELMAKSKPGQQNLLKMAACFILLVLIGNLLGRTLGAKNLFAAKLTQRDNSGEGLFSGIKQMLPIWKNEPKKPQHWYQFWN